MKAEVRQLLGRAAYEGSLKYLGKPGRHWDILGQEVQESYRSEAEAVVRHLAAMVGIPVLQMLLTEQDVKQLLELRGEDDDTARL